MPAEFGDLIRNCWHQDPTIRPSFLEVMTRLSALGGEGGTSSLTRTSTSSSSGGGGGVDRFGSWTTPSGGSASNTSTGSSSSDGTPAAPATHASQPGVCVVSRDMGDVQGEGRRRQPVAVARRAGCARRRARWRSCSRTSHAPPRCGSSTPRPCATPRSSTTSLCGRCSRSTAATKSSSSGTSLSLSLTFFLHSGKLLIWGGKTVQGQEQWGGLVLHGLQEHERRARVVHGGPAGAGQARLARGPARPSGRRRGVGRGGQSGDLQGPAGADGRARGAAAHGARSDDKARGVHRAGGQRGSTHHGDDARRPDPAVGRHVRQGARERAGKQGGQAHGVSGQVRDARFPQGYPLPVGHCS